MINKSFEFKIGVIGLGYVGTPLACLFSKKYDTWGYDIKAEKVAKLAKSTMEDNRPCLLYTSMPVHRLMPTTSMLP